MDLIDILHKEIDTKDELDKERQINLVRGLGGLNETQAHTAYQIIDAYRTKYDKNRRVGETSKSIPYYGIDIEEGTKFEISMLPMELQLILEKLLKNV